MKRKVLIIVFLIGTLSVQAQSELTLPLFYDVFQSSYLNPAVQPEHSISVGIPVLSSIYLQAIHNGFVPNSVISSANDTLRLDAGSIPKQLSKQNMLFANADLDIFHLRMNIYNWNYWFGIRQRHNISYFYPKDLVALAVHGNAQFIGEEMDFGYIGLNLNLFREYTIGASTAYQKWFFGGRISLLQGLSTMYLKPQLLKANIHDEMFDHSFATDATLYTAGIPVDDDRMLNTALFENSYWLTSYLTRFRNPGLSFALAASYEFDKKTTFSFAVSDLGFIHWSDSTLNYRVQGTSTFEGIDALGDMLDGKGFDIDSTINVFRRNFQDEEFEESFTVWLPTKFYLTANYEIIPRTNVSLQLYGVANRRFYPAITLGATQGVGRILNVALSASFNQKTFTNLGFGLMVKPGPVQIYLLADNYYTPLVDPLSFTNLNFRFGINLVFGMVKTQQGLPYR